MNEGAGVTAPALGAWTRWNGAILLGALAVALFVGRAWPVAACGVASLGALAAANHRAWTPSGSFGWANAVTATRAGMVGAVGARLDDAPAELLALVVLGLFALDGVDGYLARRRGTVSEFGALFDMETDSFLVLTVVLLLFERGDLGVWVLVGGVLRYTYVLVRALLPARNPDVARSRFGRLAFAGLVLGLFFAITVPGVVGGTAALAGTALVTLSFARSFYDSYASRSPGGGSAG
jgi:phosphatidylglycerophosphate synthase